MNNVGSNGNYWSSTPDSSDSSNAWNVNFNSSGVNRNSNNRSNGQSVRLVSVFTMNQQAFLSLPSFETPPQKLLLDLLAAWKDARRNKRHKTYQLRFERNLESELIRLRDAILQRKYHPAPSTCFIIHDPKMREVFAAQYRDRIVHHLLYNMIAPYFVKGFIRDSYSCIPGRGTLDGVKRLEEKIRKVSNNYSRPCYVLKLDISGYFMHINRVFLLKICLHELEPYKQELDFPLVQYLLETIILEDPTVHCRRVGDEKEWEGLPASKTLFCSPSDCGLPIGNLTSQLFSNVYMNVFDRYMVSRVGADCYGRYVDDAFVVSHSQKDLRRLIPLAESFLQENLSLTLSRNKTAIYSIYRGVEFLGLYLKPFRRYVAHRCLRRMESKIKSLEGQFESGLLSPAGLTSRINSFLGFTSHSRSYFLRCRWMNGPLQFAFRTGFFTNHILKFKTH